MLNIQSRAVIQHKKVKYPATSLTPAVVKEATPGQNRNNNKNNPKSLNPQQKNTIKRSQINEIKKISIH